MSQQTLPKLRSISLKPDFAALDALASSENPYKGNFYRAMVGNIGTADYGLGLVFHRFDISEEEMDRIYRAVQKLEEYILIQRRAPIIQSIMGHHLGK